MFGWSKKKDDYKLPKKRVTYVLGEPELSAGKIFYPVYRKESYDTSTPEHRWMHSSYVSPLLSLRYSDKYVLEDYFPSEIKAQRYIDSLKPKRKKKARS